jgi:predicted transcriptional regulator
MEMNLEEIEDRHKRKWFSHARDKEEINWLIAELKRLRIERDDSLSGICEICSQEAIRLCDELIAENAELKRGKGVGR